MTNDNWLPAGYEVPKSPSNYMKLDEDTNKFRILSSPVMGWSYWTKDKKPVRSSEPFEGVPDDARLDTIKNRDGSEREEFRPKHFWAFVVWNYADKRVQILEITQSTVQSAISALVTNEDWGDPKEYDITVTGKGEGLDRKYTVQPSPQKPVPVDAHKAYRAMKIDLEALFRGADPFAGGEREDAHDADSVMEKNNPFPQN
jgi:hypothetical protein